MDEHESMWDTLGLASLDPISSTSPPPSPSRSPEPAWWNRRNSPTIQVRLDGEVADPADLAAAASLDALLPLSVASGRIEKPSSKPAFRPQPSHFQLPTSPTLSHLHSPPHSVKTEPCPLPVHTPLSTSPQTPSPQPPPPPVSLPLVTKPPPQSRPLLVQHTSPPAQSRVALRSPTTIAVTSSAVTSAAVVATASGPAASVSTVPVSPSSALSPSPAAAVPSAAPAATSATTPVTSPHIPSPAPAPARSVPGSTATSNPAQLRSLSTNLPHPPTASPTQTQNTQRPAGTTPSSSAPSESTSASLKEKREREARQFPKEVLTNLDGTTSAEVRKMNATERELVLYKRKLRNRESARRSRQKRQATLGELQEEIDDLMQISGRMVEVGLSLREENSRLHERLTCALAELKGLRGVYPNEHAASRNGAGSSQAAAMKMKLGG